MSNLIHIDKEYRQWIQSLSKRFRQSQIKAAVHINQDTLRFYFELGRDIVELHSEQRWGSKFFANLSRDLKDANPEAGCFSETNLLYMKNFYLLYSPIMQITPQPGEQITITPQLGEQIFSVPWGHHKLLIDKCKGQSEKAIFYVQQTIANGWSRDMLLNIYSTDLYERHSKAITNFTKTLPDEQSDLARDITRDPYSFSFTGLLEPYNERKLKDALIANIEKFLIELGTGFAYMGREVRLQVGETEQFLDMLFYNTRLHCYERMKAANAERAKGRREYLASLDVSSFSAKERENHKKFMEMFDRREKAKAKMKGGIPDQSTIQELMEAEIQMAPIAKAQRVALARELARELGCTGEDVDTVQEAIGNIFDCTSGGGLGGLEDMMDAGGVPLCVAAYSEQNVALR